MEMNLSGQSRTITVLSWIIHHFKTELITHMPFGRLPVQMTFSQITFWDLRESQ